MIKSLMTDTNMLDMHFIEYDSDKNLQSFQYYM